MSFKKGQSGNTGGRPKGVLNGKTQLINRWAEQHGEDWINQLWGIATSATEKTSDRLTALQTLGKKAFADMKAVEHSGEIADSTVAEKVRKLNGEQLKALMDIELLDDEDDTND